jgi:hypothetical protein
MTKYTVTNTDRNYTYTSEVQFDGKVYRWVSNNRVPPKDTIVDYKIDQLPNFDLEAHNKARDQDVRDFFNSLKPQKKKRITIREQAEAQIELAQRAVQLVVQDLEPHPFGHAFLWGTVEVTLKNGKTRLYKTCLGSVCAEDLDKAVRLANSINGVSGVYYNLD